MSDEKKDVVDVDMVEIEKRVVADLSRPGYPIRNLGSYFTDRDQDPHYRASMIDAGRGHLLR